VQCGPAPQPQRRQRPVTWTRRRINMTSMRVLLATDGSEGAAAAAAWLLTFPLPKSATVRVITVAVLPPAPPVDESMDELRRRLLEQARLIASNARDLLVKRWTVVEELVSDGDPREEIVRAAEEWPADLVVLGARGLTPLKRVLLGSVSTSVARHVDCPVLVVKGRRQGLRAAVVAVDGSADSLWAAGVFASLPLDPGLQLRLFTAVEPPIFAVAPEVPGGMSPIDQVLRDRQAAAARTLRRVEADFKEKITAVERSVVVGRAGEHIVNAANDPGTDLVVVGARGFGAFKRLVLGIISEYVLHHAECPVLIVRSGESRHAGSALE
jgi:nucleotide-binding universal stress UspA family protein